MTPAQYAERLRKHRVYNARRRLEENPNLKVKVVNYPAIWDETFLTERWEDRKARRARALDGDGEQR
jgi:quinol monooxygenase YgiN